MDPLSPGQDLLSSHEHVIAVAVSAMIHLFDHSPCFYFIPSGIPLQGPCSTNWSKSAVPGICWVWHCIEGSNLQCTIMILLHHHSNC